MTTELKTKPTTPAVQFVPNVFRGLNQIGAIIRRLPPSLDVGVVPFWRLMAWSMHGFNPQFCPKHFDIMAGECTVHGLVDFDLNTGKAFVQPTPKLTAIGAVALGLSNAAVTERVILGAMVLDRVGHVAFASGDLTAPENSPVSNSIFDTASNKALEEVPSHWRFLVYDGRDDHVGKVDHDITEKVRVVVDRGVRSLL